MHPTYRGVAEMIRSWIASGRYKPGDRLPTHQEIAKRLGTTRQTVVAAIKTLAQEGLVETGGSRGTWVRAHVHFVTDATSYDDVKTERPDGIDAFNAAVLADQREPSTRFEMRIEPAPADIADRLGIKPDELVCVRSVLQLVDERPWSRATSYYPMDITTQCGLDTPHDIPGGTVRRMAEHGLVEAGSVDEVNTRPPSADEARDLSAPDGTAMIVWIRTAATADRVTRVTVSVMPGDRNGLQFRQGEPDAIASIVAARSAEREDA